MQTRKDTATATSKVNSTRDGAPYPSKSIGQSHLLNASHNQSQNYIDQSPAILEVQQQRNLKKSQDNLNGYLGPIKTMVRRPKAFGSVEKVQPGSVSGHLPSTTRRLKVGSFAEGDFENQTLRQLELLKSDEKDVSILTKKKQVYYHNMGPGLSNPSKDELKQETIDTIINERNFRTAIGQSLNISDYSKVSLNAELCKLDKSKFKRSRPLAKPEGHAPLTSQSARFFSPTTSHQLQSMVLPQIRGAHNIDRTMTDYVQTIDPFSGTYSQFNGRNLA